MPEVKDQETSTKRSSYPQSFGGKLRSFHRGGSTGLKGIVQLSYSYLDLLLTIALAAIAWLEIMPRATAGPSVLPALSFLDQSWNLEFAFKADHGILLGRDTVFTYGPLYQWLWSLPSRVQGFSLGSFFATHELFQLWMILAFTYATTALLLRGYAPWKRAFYILLIVAFWEPLEVRSSFVLFAVACIVYQIQRAPEAEGRPILRAAITSLVVISGFLISADSGIYACAIFTITGVVNLCLLYRDRIKLRRLIHFSFLSAIFSTLWVLLVNSFMRGPMYFGFWKASFETADNYRWTVAGPMVPSVRTWFFAIIAFGCCAFIFAWLRRQLDSKEIIQHPASLLSVFLSSLLVLQSGMVRSDWGHVLMGLFPIVALSFAMLMGNSNQQQHARPIGDLPMLLVVILTGIFSGPTWYVQPSTLLTAFKPVAKAGCPADRLEFDHACIVQQDYEKLAPVSDYLTKHTSERDRILVFPYENIYGDVSRRIVSGGVLQPYAALSPYLVNRDLEGIAADKPPVAIYSVDGVTTGEIDGVPNITRSPELWFYLQSHYEQETEIWPGILALRLNQERHRRLNMRTTPLTFNSSVQKIRMGKDLIVAPSLHWPADADFLRLRITVQYPFWWRLFKPARTVVEIRSEDGSYASFPILINPNKPNEIWIYPWDERQLTHYFAPNAETWRIGNRAPLMEMRLRFEPIDFISVAPSKMAVDDLSAVSLALE